MDISEMGETQLKELAQQIQDRLNLIAQEKMDNHNANKQEVYEAISTLEGLLGEENPDPPTMENLLIGNVSIREVRLFSAEDLAAYSGLALQLVLAGMEVMTSTQLALARIESRRA